MPNAVAIDTYVEAMKRHNVGKVVLLGVGGCIGTVFWAISLRHDLLSRAVTISTVVNLLAVVVVGVSVFHEELS